MKDIGQSLKGKREENGLSLEEVASDLKLRPNQIASIENGNKDDFKDVFELKNIIIEYAKYLGMDSEKLIDEFNEYMFDCTSKISVSAIREALENENINKVSSPYTVKKKKNKFHIFAFICGLVIVLVFVMCLVIRLWR